jgi:hypothetical protein
MNLGESERGLLPTPTLQLLLSQLKLDNGTRIYKEPNSNPLAYMALHRFC